MDDAKWLVLVLAIDTGIGLFVGQAKRRVFAGVALGLLLGPLGWLITALLPSGADPRAGECPYCLSLIPRLQTECAHCNRHVVWVGNKPRKPSGAALTIGH